MNNIVRYILGIIALAIIVLRALYPDLKFDTVSFTLLGLACILFLVKDFDGLINRIKKAKIGSVEVELSELSKEANEVAEKTRLIKQISISGPAFDTMLADEKEKTEGKKSFIKRIQDDKSIRPDDSSSLVLLSAEIENKLRELIERKTLLVGNEPISFLSMAKELRDEEVFDKKTFELLDHFWKIRNKIIHSHKEEFSRRERVALFDIALIILGILEARLESDEEGTTLVYQD